MAKQKPNHKDYEPTLEGMSAYMSEVIKWMIETDDLMSGCAGCDPATRPSDGCCYCDRLVPY